MKIKLVILLFIFGFISFCGSSSQIEKRNDKRNEFISKRIDKIIPRLEKLGKDIRIIEAVREENNNRKTLEEIKKIDKEWRATGNTEDYMTVLMKNKCAQFLKTLQIHNTFFSEVFVMDNLGANVAMTDKTSDYWQGDEDKFIKSFVNGKGGIHRGEIEFDNSTKAFLIQVSIPVIDGNYAIGAITFGVDVNKI
jgi:hypothetical protein